MTTDNKTPILVFRPTAYTAVTSVGTYTIHCGLSGAYVTFFNDAGAAPLTAGIEDIGLTFDQCVQRCAQHALRLAAELARALDPVQAAADHDTQAAGV